MPTLVEIGPSNASQGQHRRKEATKELKKLTLARSRTQDPAYPAQVRYRYATGAVAYPEFLSYISFHLLKLTSLPFPSCGHIRDMLFLLSVFK